MKQTYTVHYNKNMNRESSSSREIKVDEVGECPCCHFATSPTYIDGFLIVDKKDKIPITTFLVLYCPRCNNIYIAKYTSTTGLNDFKLDFVFPQQSQLIIFSEEINKLSPEFVSIYNQSIEAESNSITQGLAGLGFRKSLEFLIKDYLIKYKHQNKNTIINLDLGKCVDKLDDDLKDIAKASVWIGNDEVHYFRKNPEYDTETLKAFINCLVLEIDIEYSKKKAKELIHKK